MNNRRVLLQVAVSIAAAQVRIPALALTADEADYEDIATPFPSRYRLYGTKPSTPPEDQKAIAILGAAPTGKSPIEVARYFETIVDTNTDTPPRYYNAQWSDRWNPVIIGFYQSTSLKKSYVFKKGDTIDWCAAFVNWCLIRSGYQHTGSAMSGSFRLGKGLGRPTDDPKPGDIVVFRKADPDMGKLGFGHVCFFVSRERGGLRVLGGNQKAGRKYSSVNTTVIPEKGDRLVLDSFRSLSTIPRSKETFVG